MLVGSSSVDTPLWPGSGGGSEPYAAESIRACYKRITRCCLHAGLSSADADDLAQDLWEWLIRTGVPMSVIATPWLKRVVHNFILRVRRWNHRHRLHEGLLLETAPEPIAWQPETSFDSSELLDRVCAHLSERERHLVALIRRGSSMAEASKLLGIPHGSRTYYRRQLVAHARRELNRRDLIRGPDEGMTAEPPGEPQPG